MTPKYPERRKATDILSHTHGQCLSTYPGCTFRASEAARMQFSASPRVELSLSLRPFYPQAIQLFTSLIQDGEHLWFHLKKKKNPHCTAGLLSTHHEKKKRVVSYLHFRQGPRRAARSTTSPVEECTARLRPDFRIPAQLFAPP